MRVLVAGNGRRFCDRVTAILRERGCVVEETLVDDDLVLDLQHDGYQAAVIDDRSGIIDLLKDARRSGVTLPILAFSEAHKDDAPLLNAGADDVLSLGMHDREIEARIRACVRRSVGLAQHIVTAGPIEIDFQKAEVTVDGRRLHITRTEWGMLELLALHRGKPVSKERIMSHLYGGEDGPEQKIIDVYACKLRRKLGEAGIYIETVWGRGYRLQTGVTEPVLPPVNTRGPGRRPKIAPKVLARLLDGPADQAALINTEGVAPFQVAPVIARAKLKGFVESRREPASGSKGFAPAIYSLTDAGRQWLGALLGDAA